MQTGMIPLLSISVQTETHIIVWMYAIGYFLIALFFLCILFSRRGERKRKERKRENAWKDYLRYKASRGEFTDENGREISLSEIS